MELKITIFLLHSSSAACGAMAIISLTKNANAPRMPSATIRESQPNAGLAGVSTDTFAPGALFPAGRTGWGEETDPSD
jgi:hypothetical protein